MKTQWMFLARAIAMALLFPACAHTTPTSTPNKTWRIAVVSDMNQDYGSKAYTPALKTAIAHIRQSGVNLVLSTGDMVAGQKRGLDYAGMWNAFHAHVTRPLGEAAAPLLPSPGNHDASPGFQNEREHYSRSWNQFPIERFNAQKPADEQVQYLPGVAQNFPFNYAVTMGPAIFIALDATVSGRLANDQLAWLESVLQKSAPYSVKMVFGHMPLMPFTFQRSTDYLGSGNATLARQLETMLEQYQVDFFLSGHHHGYFPGRRLGQVRYVSVPLLGTGARYLLTADRSETKRSPESFLYFEFDAAGNISMNALRSPSLTEITASDLPAAISIPTRDASDCRGCAAFPSNYFIDSRARILYQRF